MSRPTISLIIPALNEERGIVATLKRVPKEITEVLVVDGGSKDRTVELAEANGARVVVERLRGYGLAYKRGFAEAKGLKLGQVAQPLRAALTGKASSPPLFEMLALLGREESIGRLRAYKE